MNVRKLMNMLQVRQQRANWCYQPRAQTGTLAELLSCCCMITLPWFCCFPVIPFLVFMPCKSISALVHVSV